MNWYIAVLKKYAEFSGRARRKEYWMFVLINLIVGLVLNYVSAFLYGIYSLAVLVPSIAVGVRRLHDIGKTGWLLLIAIIPVLGWILLLVWLAKDSQPGNNQYGENPKGV
jgi:uncharacterized membrane protein YhaH (DUF805 family)